MCRKQREEKKKKKYCASNTKYIQRDKISDPIPCNRNKTPIYCCGERITILYTIAMLEIYTIMVFKFRSHKDLFKYATFVSAF